ncbi:MAC/perforin domain-containing protein [uncultured Sphingobacterium sp.]|uniref:MAC/perforin domain-containing protein n=1 Tax=uncultured Sphingobacterium sp. TaxID=182688 RepID=UPI0025FB9BAD|nr:MAC/perforin domain-containing protein [uncultured Sphingobacterium sp.]
MSKIKLSGLLIASVVLLTNCKKNELHTDLLLNNNSNHTAVMGGPYQVLGYGYDITGEYLASSSIKSVVFDAAAYHKATYPLAYRGEFIGEIDSKAYFGSDYMSYIREIEKKTNFKGSTAEEPKGTTTDAAKVPYSFSLTYSSNSVSKETSTSKYSFGRVDIIKKQKQHLLPDAKPSDLVNYLTPGFKNDVINLSPNALINKYGTHVLLDITTGGSYTSYFASEITNNTSYDSKSKMIEGVAGFVIGKLGLNFSSNLSKEQKEEYTRRQSNWSTSILTRGGTTNGQTININANDEVTQTLSLDSWARTVDDQNCVLVDINFNKTYPLYDFINDPIKKQNIKNAVIAHLASKEKTVLQIKPMHQLKSKNGDTWWVFSKDEVDFAVNTYGDQYHGVIGYVVASPQTNTKPMYRMKSRKTGDTWYAFSKVEADYAVAKWNEISYGIDGYLYSTEQANTKPMYRLKSKNSSDTWYVFNLADVLNAQNKWNDQYIALDGYILN